MNVFKASQVNPSAWWTLGLSLAISAALVSSVAALIAIIGLAIAITLYAREHAPWSKSLSFYLLTAGAVIVIRVLFRIIFNFDSESNVVFSLPVISIALGSLGQLDLFGSVSFSALFSAFTDGLKMAAIIISVGLANTLANPRRLLKNTPGALYEVASAWIIAVNMAPQLIQSAARVRKARRLRGRTKRHHITSSMLIPVLEDTIDRSLALAASMSSRGFGRMGALSKNQALTSRGISVLGVVSLSIGSYLLLTSKAAGLPLSLIVCGCLSIVVTTILAGQRQIHTRYKPDRWRKRDFVVLLGATGLLVSAILVGR